MGAIGIEQFSVVDPIKWAVGIKLALYSGGCTARRLENDNRAKRAIFMAVAPPVRLIHPINGRFVNSPERALDPRSFQRVLHCVCERVAKWKSRIIFSAQTHMD